VRFQPSGRYECLAGFYAGGLYPLGAEEFGLGEDGFDGFLLKIGWVAVFVEDAFDHDFDLGAGALAEGPVDGDAFLHLSDELGGDDLCFRPRTSASNFTPVPPPCRIARNASALHDFECPYSAAKHLHNVGRQTRPDSSAPC
jgi:hypothetical protein